MSIRLLVASDHEVVRAGLRSWLQEDELEIVGEAVTAEEAVASAAELRPDLILLDVQLGQTSGFEVLNQLKADDPQRKVVMYAYDSPRYAGLTSALGGDGVVARSATREVLLETLRSAASGTARSRRASAREVQEIPSNADLEIGLTPRERQVLAGLARGSTNKQVAAELEISYETVKEHVQHILQKMAVADRTQAAVWAVRSGLV